MQIQRKPMAAFLIVESLLIWVPMIILGSSINWPGSLSEPAASVLPLIYEQKFMMMAGYFAYLVYSILFFPMAYLFIAYLEGGQIKSHLAWIGIGFAGLSTLARSLGIIRWLSSMPLLAEAWHTMPGREIELIYSSLNAYAGSIGEVLGVGLFAAIWVLIASKLLLQKKLLPAWLGWMGLVSGISVMAPVIELFGIDLGPLIVVTTALIHFWWIFMGIALLVKPVSNPKVA